jgi:hypothetical protein
MSDNMKEYASLKEITDHIEQELEKLKTGEQKKKTSRIFKMRNYYDNNMCKYFYISCFMCSIPRQNRF